MIQVRTFVFNILEENCYVVWDDAHRGGCWVIDCGAQSAEEFETLSLFLISEGLTPVLHLLTHAHFDHVWGAMLLDRHYGLRPTLLDEESLVYDGMKEQVRSLLHIDIKIPLPPVEDFLSAGQLLHLSNYTFKVIATPGHTPGGCCYYCAEAGLVFTGDTLFHGAHGRTDFPGGSYEDLHQSLLRLQELPAATRVLPGHGPDTTIGAEAHIII